MYINKSRAFLKDLFSKKTLHKIVRQLYNPNQSDLTKAFSAAIGVFIGILPIWGLQTIVAIFTAIGLKLNKVLVLIFVHISFPPMFPLIIFLSYKTGSIYMNVKGKVPNQLNAFSWQFISHNFEQYLYGSITLAILAGIVTGLITFLFLKLIKQNRLSVSLEEAI